MSGSTRLAGGIVLAALAALLVSAGPAQAAQPDVYLNVNPNTIQVGLHASCGDDLNPARVRSEAFGQVTLNPQHGSRALTGSATVPGTTRAGEYDVMLTCADGATANAKLIVLGAARPTRGPATGGGGIAGGGWLAPLLLATGGLAALVAGGGLLLTRRRA